MCKSNVFSPSEGISVVIPALNESECIQRCLERLPEGVGQVIVADGGSVDGTRGIARAHGAHVVVSAPGRGGQLNAGAAAARCDVILFLHADTELPDGALAAIHLALSDPAVVGGGFALSIDSRDPFLHWVARVATLRSRRLGMFYGDQALFVRRDVFGAVGGFEPIPIMEDVALVRALRRRGRLALVDSPVRTSARRWERENPLYVTLRNWALVALYSMGVAPQRLARWYRPEGD